MLFLLFIVYILFANSLQSERFTTKQWKSIRSLFKNPGLTKEMRSKINYEIFIRYSDFAKKKAYQFKKKYKRGTKNIKTKELILYSMKGLWLSINNYNATFPFYHHANKYIYYALYEGYTKLQPTTLLPEYIRKRRNNSSIPLYNNMLRPIFYGLEDFQIEKNNNYNIPFDNSITNTMYYDLWQKYINTMDPLTILIFKYKFDVYFNKIRTNKQVAQLISCSEETVRLHINKIKLFHKTNNDIN